MSGSWHHLVAGVAAALVLPLLVFGLQFPFLIAAVIAGVAYFGLVLLLAPRRLADRLKLDQVGRAQAELVEDLVQEGEATVARLREAGRALRSAKAATVTAHLAEVAKGILDGLAADPGKLSAVRRFLTYYLPRSAEIAEGLKVVEGQRVPNPGRQAEIEAILGKLDQAFTFYADSLSQTELDSLDVELRLMGRALAEDIGADRIAPVPIARKGS